MRVGASTIIALAAMVASAPVTAREIVAGSTEIAGVLGGAYQSHAEEFVGDRCVTGDVERAGLLEATFNLDQSLSHKEASEKLAVSASGKARFGVTKASARANFARQTSESAFSTSVVWLAEYKLGSRKLTNAKRTTLGDSVATTDIQWLTTCGDEYVSEIIEGGKFFLVVRIDFASKEDKRSFDASFSLSGKAYSAKASIEQASKKYAGNATIKVQALQMGGDTSRVTGVIGGAAGASDFVQCSFFDIQKCLSALTRAIAYASDLENGFPSTLRGPESVGRLDQEYRTTPYSAAGIYPKDFPGLTATILDARRKLLLRFEGEFAAYNLAESILAQPGLPAGHRTAIGNDKAIIQTNLDAILAAGKVCYSTPEKCPQAFVELKLAEVDPLSHYPPSLPTVSARLFSALRGVWPRDESVAAMAGRINVGETPHCKETQPTPWYCKGQRVGLADAALRLSTSDLSEVLLVEGKGLSKAELFFEKWKLLDVDLANASEFPAKNVGPDQRVLVMTTIRQGKDWIDLPFYPKTVETLAAEGSFAGEGTVYLVISDAFGRKTRKELAYMKWSCSTNNAVTYSNVRIMHRWWGPENQSFVIAGSPEFDFARTFFNNYFPGKICEGGQFVLFALEETN